MDRNFLILLITFSLLFIVPSPSIGFTTMSADRGVNADVSKENSGILNISNEADSIKQGASGATLVNVTNPLTRTQNNTVKLSDETTWHLSSTGTDKKTVTLSSDESQTYKVDVGSSATTGNATYWIIARDGVYTFRQSRVVDIQSSDSCGDAATYTDIIDSFEDQELCEYSYGSPSSLKITNNWAKHGSYSVTHSKSSAKMAVSTSGLDNTINDGTRITTKFRSIGYSSEPDGVIFGYNSSNGAHYRAVYYDNSGGYYTIKYYDGSQYTKLLKESGVWLEGNATLILEWQNYGQRVEFFFRVEDESGEFEKFSGTINKEKYGINTKISNNTGFVIQPDGGADELKVKKTLPFGTFVIDTFEDGSLSEWDGSATLTTSPVYSGSYALSLAQTETRLNRTHVDSPGAPNVGDTVSMWVRTSTKGSSGGKGVVQLERASTSSSDTLEVVYKQSYIRVREKGSSTYIVEKSINPSGWYNLQVKIIDKDSIRVISSDGGTEMTNFTVNSSVSMDPEFDRSDFVVYKTNKRGAWMDEIKLTDSTSRDFN